MSSSENTYAPAFWLMLRWSGHFSGFFLDWKTAEYKFLLLLCSFMQSYAPFMLLVLGRPGPIAKSLAELDEAHLLYLAGNFLFAVTMALWDASHVASSDANNLTKKFSSLQGPAVVDKAGSKQIERKVYWSGWPESATESLKNPGQRRVMVVTACWRSGPSLRDNTKAQLSTFLYIYFSSPEPKTAGDRARSQDKPADSHTKKHECSNAQIAQELILEDSRGFGV
ncbi:hypothetical protein BT96DRAFT_973496 [Gymnopus androsaceus JB14]|uniref:Uncharacterized protein n=1 Tax=Gymnopus androsaceus JB14 TaxID=1447944 RepID=A0A6A4HZB9_9AGAR|nr:hypothetical protein BT96DRAFT_973496 [Gymnopus androsaceus JB14]